jgi:beta-galactosidase
MNVFQFSLILFLSVFISSPSINGAEGRPENEFGKNWRFHLGDTVNGQEISFNDTGWRVVNLPHDWSIEGKFSKDNPAGVSGGALPGGIGWYRKTFTVPSEQKDKLFFIDFDGVYRNSEVWINGYYLGMRPYGYSSFRYELTSHLNWNGNNVIAVKVDNSKQPNSRWYSGSGIYRNVYLVSVNKIYVDHWGTFITTPHAGKDESLVHINTKIVNRENEKKKINFTISILDEEDFKVAETNSEIEIEAGNDIEDRKDLVVKNPKLWSTGNPHLYKAVATIISENNITDTYTTIFGIREFEFDPEKGFSLNGISTKINGVCLHHDLGALGAAVNKRAIERQLEIMKKMGVNAIRTSHNPPAQELLDLTDKMGFIVMDEVFDVWSKKKTEFDYALDWNEWHIKDLQDFIKRDRNHPSVIIWSIGNELTEQYDKNDPAGTNIANELYAIVRSLDTTRVITAGLNDPDSLNPILKSNGLDIIGYNYNHDKYISFTETYPGKSLIATETTSALATRGSYDMPSDSIRNWPVAWDIPLLDGNADNSCSSYDNCHVPWGATHEEALKTARNNNFVSGMFIWTGFDYIGEPTPYLWPSRSSYFGIVDLCGFPKDAFYLYQSEWTDQPVLHLFPHWNWNQGDNIDIWCYTNMDEVELFLNGKSLGSKKKTGGQMHIVWNTIYTPGTLKAVGSKEGREGLVRQINTAGKPLKIILQPDRTTLSADGNDLCFVTVKVVDKDSNLVPYADNLVSFEISGSGNLAAVDNGLQTSIESFKTNSVKAFNGMCLAIIQADETVGRIIIKAASPGLEGTEVTINSELHVSVK